MGGSSKGSGLIVWLMTDPPPSCLQVKIGGVPVRVGGFAKGSGMIHPNMATMLAIITTDASVDPALWRTMLQHGTAKSFNQVSSHRAALRVWPRAAEHEHSGDAAGLDLQTGEPALCCSPGMAESKSVSRHHAPAWQG